MDRQFQNYSKIGQKVSYMERPNNQAQAQNHRIQNNRAQNNNIDMSSRNQAGPPKQIYNPNPEPDVELKGSNNFSFIFFGILIFLSNTEIKID